MENGIKTTAEGAAEGPAAASPTWQLSTIAAHGGFCVTDKNRPSQKAFTGGGKALWTSSAFEVESLQQHQEATYFYRRFGGPNADDFAHAIASLESAEAGLATSTGMGAIVATVMGILNTGDTVLVHGDAYGGTFVFFKSDAKRFGIDVKFVDVLDPDILEATLSTLTTGDTDTANAKAAAENGREGHDSAIPEKKEQEEKIPKKKKVMVFVETITNPLIRVADVPAICTVAKKYGALVVVDNTFATPLRAQPLLQGADLVVHSATKSLGGHDDLLAGVVVGSSEHVKQATRLAITWGLGGAAFDSWLALRGLRTLQVRLERSWATAETLVKRLSASGLVLAVHSAPKCALFAMEIHGGLEGVNRALETFRLIKLLTSLGGVTTTASHSASSSHKALPPLEREKLGIRDGLLRISVGLEDVEDLWVDFQHGLSAAAKLDAGDRQ